MATLVISSGILLHSQEPPKFVWDYSDQQIADNGTVRFEIQIDAGGWLDVGMVEHTPGTYEAPVPVTPNGQHSFEVRACDAQNTCGAVASMVYTSQLTLTATKVGNDADIVP